MQIGSTILKSGLTIITIDAIITPMDCKRSPIKWTTAALMLMFSWWEWELSCLWTSSFFLSWWCSWLWSSWIWLWQLFEWFLSSFLLRWWWWCFYSDFNITDFIDNCLLTSSNSSINFFDVESFRIADWVSKVPLDYDSISLETGYILLCLFWFN